MDELRMTIAENNYRVFDELFYWRCRKSSKVNTMMWLDPLHQNEYKICVRDLYKIYLNFDRKTNLYYEIIKKCKLYNSYYHVNINSEGNIELEIDFKCELDRKIIIEI
jgi:hypothetical protein